MRTDTNLGDLGFSLFSTLIYPHQPHYVYVAIIVRPMNSESFDPAREEWVHLDSSVEDVERSVPVVQVLKEIKVSDAEDATRGNVTMCRDGMKIQKATYGGSTGE